MDFYTVLDQTAELLRSRGRVSYRALKEHFGLDDDSLDALRAELLYAYPGAVEEDERGLIWTAEHHGERRQLTMFFCDLVGSTSLASQFDPEVWREIVGSYYDTCAKVIARFDGHIATYLGDGLLVYFGYPRAHEDDAQRAVRAGLGIIEAIAALNIALAQRYSITLAVRVGCHTGLVVVGDDVGGTGHDDMVLGDTPNVASRLQGVAAPDTLVVSGSTHRLLGGLFNCRFLGRPELKGVSTPPDVYQVLSESTASTRLEALGAADLIPLVGRTAELNLLEECWATIVGGHGQVLLINGEAGIGKSRLVRALTEHAAEQNGWLTPCRGSPYHHDTALYPFIDLFHRVILRPTGSEETAEAISQLEGFLVQGGLPLDEAMPLLCSLLSIPAPPDYPVADLPPDQQKQRTMNTLRTILFNRAARQPVLFVVEDLHWVDPTTLELLTVLIEQISDARILAVLTCRPDFASPWPGRDDVLTINLGRLQPDDAVALTQTVAGGKSLPKPIIDEVVAKTDGVPLFIEELTKTVVESGWLEERADRYVMTGPMPPMAIPNTLHDSLMARLDRLSSVKSLAQLGAVIGREFSYRLIAAASPWGPKMLQDGLAELVAAEFVYQRGVAPEATYRFKHALIQDAAYQSLLLSTRQHHHQLIATALAEKFPEVVDSQPEVLARHYTAAGLAEQAIPLWEAAAQRALQGFANQEAANHAARALELLDTQPETENRWKQELHLQLMLAAAATPVGGPHAAEPMYTRACELACKVGGTAEVFPALAGLAYAKIVQGHLHEARTLAGEFLNLAAPLDDPVVSSVGHWVSAYTAWWQGDISEVRRHSRQCLALCSPEQHRAGMGVYNNNPGIVCGYLDALASWALGFPDQAVDAMEQTLTHARGIDHPYSLAVSLLFSAQLFQLRREPQRARPRAEEALAVSSEHGLHALSLWCLLPRGWAMIQQGKATAGIADIREAMDRRRAMGMGAVWPWFLTLYAEACGELGDFEEGVRATGEALHWVRRNGERLYAPEAHRVRGELLLSKPATEATQAEQCFDDALAVARAIGAKSWELRAATSMAATLGAQGRSSEGRNLLAAVYNWFTEGFDTPDLKAAKTLLDQL